MGIEIAWSVGVEATGDRILPTEQIVELADAVAPRGGSASGIGTNSYGATFLVYAEPTRCSSPFPAITMPNAYAIGGIHGAPRNAKGARLASTTTASTSPVSQTRNVKVGRGRNGKRARMARTAGL